MAARCVLLDKILHGSTLQPHVSSHWRIDGLYLQPPTLFPAALDDLLSVGIVKIQPAELADINRIIRDTRTPVRSDVIGLCF